VKKLYLVIFGDTVLLNGLPQVDGDGVFEFLNEMGEDCAAATQHFGNVQQLANLCFRFQQCPLS